VANEQFLGSLIFVGISLTIYQSHKQFLELLILQACHHARALKHFRAIIQANVPGEGRVVDLLEKLKRFPGKVHTVRNYN